MVVTYSWKIENVATFVNSNSNWTTKFWKKNTDIYKVMLLNLSIIQWKDTSPRVKINIRPVLLYGKVMTEEGIIYLNMCN